MDHASNNYSQIAATDYSPKRRTAFITYSRVSKSLRLSNGLKQNLPDFHLSLRTLIDEHFVEHDVLKCFIHLEKLNIPTLQLLFQLCSALREKQQNHAKSITIFWTADWHDLDMICTGSELAEIYGLQIEILTA